MKKSKDQRGFTTFDEFECTYGTKVVIKESSAASGPHVWLFLDENPEILKSGLGSAAAHLTMEQVDAMIAALTAIRQEHYQIRHG